VSGSVSPAEVAGHANVVADALGDPWRILDALGVARTWINDAVPNAGAGTATLNFQLVPARHVARDGLRRTGYRGLPLVRADTRS
jgi:hypothetical protein